MEEGFGDVKTVKTVKFSLKKFEKHTLKIRPIFLDAKPAKSAVTGNLKTRKTCLCDRWKETGPPVPPAGSKKASYVFIASDPGQQEVENGEPFWPDAPGGRVFEEYLDVLGLDRSSVYITNVCFCRGRNNRPPTPDEVISCARFHMNEYKELTGVKYYIPLGSVAFRLITGVYSTITPYVGGYFDAELFKRKVKIIPIHHPGYVLRRPKEKANILELLEKLVS